MNCDSPAGAASAPPPEAWLGAWADSAAFVYCRDVAGRMLAANRAFARKFGRTSESLSDTSAADLIHPEDAPAFSAEVATGLPPRRAISEHRWLTPQGWRWISWEEQAVFNERGRFTAVRAVGHDITRQRLVEEQYLKLSSAVEQSPVAIAITDTSCRVQYVNSKFTETTGQTLEAIIERNLDVLRDGHPDEDSYRQFRETVAAGREWRGELCREGPDGQRIWESVSVCCLRSPTGDITNFLCLRENITGRKLLEDQLRQAQKMESLGTLAGGIAHDFNNILAVINGYAELHLLHPGDEASQQKSLREIKRAVQRASGLVRQILTFSRKAEVRFSAVDLNQHLRDLIALLSETFPRNITFNLVLAEQLPPLLADHNQLQQIVLNLCVNARDAMPEGGVITLATTQRTNQAGRPCACLEVTDTGVGMPPEVRARIFEPFFTTKGGNRGTGLGLAVVYGIVASHAGTLEVDSTPGVGSTFRIFLPLAETQPAAAAVARVGEFPGGTESLLIVDDEASLRTLLGTALSRKGYSVLSASDGIEAIECLNRTDVKLDAVLLDLNMPGATGVDVLKVIKASKPDLKVLVVTGHLTAEARAEFEALGHTSFVRKPYTLDELGRQLRSLLDGDDEN